MKFYYSLLKISPNTASDDAISIGMIAFDKKGARILLSENRKNIAKKLLANNSPDLVDFICKQMTNKVKEINTLAQKKKKPQLFDEQNLFDPKYFDYLSNYSNGVFQFSKSNVFLNRMNNENLELLFQNTIEKTQIKPIRTKKTEISKIIQEKLINRVKDKVHTNIILDSNIIPSVYFQFDMDCIGKNGVFTGAKTLDFEQSKPTLDKQISHYNTLIASLSISYKKSIKDNNFFLIAEEPKSLKSENHEIWDAIQKTDLFKIIHPEEAEIVAKKIEETKAGKFLEARE